jgi:hypothetical protein
MDDHAAKNEQPASFTSARAIGAAIDLSRGIAQRARSLTEFLRKYAQEAVAQIGP